MKSIQLKSNFQNKNVENSDNFTALYEHRVMSDGRGDVKNRINQFKNTFRVKYNNWYNSNSARAFTSNTENTPMNDISNANRV